MAEAIIETDALPKPEGVALWLFRASQLFALIAGVLLVAMAVMSLVSIVGRAFFSKPILGDYELVQMLCAMAVALVLPFTHAVRGHVIVDFFTTGASRRAKTLMDIVANAVLAFFAFVFAWRMTIGLLGLRDSQDVSMLLELPTWWGYVPFVPSFALLGLISLAHIAKDLKSLAVPATAGGGRS
jgi:TRAP-type C4-dicarboxylate transport system permease small subunit